MNTLTNLTTEEQTRNESSLNYRWLRMLCHKFPGAICKVDARCVANSPKGFYFFEGNTGLNASWGPHHVFLQLPLKGNKLIRLWLAKAFKEAQRNKCIVWVFVPRLVPSNKWFIEYSTKAKKLVFIEGRITLEGEENKLPYSSCFMEFDGRPLGGPMVHTLAVKEVLETYPEVPRNRLDWELKNAALDDPYSILYQNVKPVAINTDSIRFNEELYKHELEGKEVLINLPG